MKQSQLNIFDPAKNEVFSEADERSAKSVLKKKRKRREAKKAPMLLDSYSAEVRGQKSEVRSQRSDGQNLTSGICPLTSEDKPHIYTVTEFTEKIKKTLEGALPDAWITGEVTDYRNRTGRHLYFSVKDSSNKIRIVVFNADSRTIPFELKDGLEIVVHGKINVYGPQGYYSIIADYVEPKGIGALQLAFEQLKKKLELEGLFAPAHKKPLPYLPRKIGVVTSPTGAAIRDIVHVLTRRFPTIEILLYPVRVQGEGAGSEVADAIAELNNRNDLDLLIVGRGGGSIEDLWAFNEEVVARAIYASRIPIISAVGHEIDFTIADFVADRRAATPSAAAEIAVPVKADLLSFIIDRRRKLALALSQVITNRSHELKRLVTRLSDPRKKLPDLMLKVDSLRQRIIFAAKVGLEKREQRLVKLVSNLDHLSPLGVLAKGYAVVENAEGAIIRSSDDVNIGAAISLRLHKGTLETKVVSKKE